MDDCPKGRGQAGCGERGLAALHVDVELTALGPRAGRGFGLVDRRWNAVEVKGAGEHETAQTRADDRYSGHCRTPMRVNMERCSIHMGLEQSSRTVKTGRMAAEPQGPQRRPSALSKARIVEAAIEILDAEGASAPDLP